VFSCKENYELFTMYMIKVHTARQTGFLLPEKKCQYWHGKRRWYNLYYTCMSQSAKDWLKFRKVTHKIKLANFAAPVRVTSVTKVWFCRKKKSKTRLGLLLDLLCSSRKKSLHIPTPGISWGEGECKTKPFQGGSMDISGPSFPPLIIILYILIWSGMMRETSLSHSSS